MLVSAHTLVNIVVLLRLAVAIRIADMLSSFGSKTRRWVHPEKPVHRVIDCLFSTQAFSARITYACSKALVSLTAT